MRAAEVPLDPRRDRAEDGRAFDPQVNAVDGQAFNPLGNAVVAEDNCWLANDAKRWLCKRPRTAIERACGVLLSGTAGALNILRAEAAVGPTA